MGQTFQYAKLPVFQYQNFDTQYQSFDRNTLKFSFYPVIEKPSQSLTPDKNQDDKPAETEKDPPDAPADESSTPADASTAPDPGK